MQLSAINGCSWTSGIGVLKLRHKHAESLDNCVRCHRSASGEGEGKGSREGEEIENEASGTEVR